MSKPLIIVTGFIYLYVAIEQLWKGNTGMGIAYAAYSMANVGLYMELV